MRCGTCGGSSWKRRRAPAGTSAVATRSRTGYGPAERRLRRPRGHLRTATYERQYRRSQACVAFIAWISSGVGPANGCTAPKV